MVLLTLCNTMCIIKSSKCFHIIPVAAKNTLLYCEPNEVFGLVLRVLFHEFKSMRKVLRLRTRDGLDVGLVNS